MKLERREPAIRIATFCKRDAHDDFVAYHMANTRWLRISESLGRLGYDVDMIVDTPAGIVQKAPGLRWVPVASARWHEYDVVKTEYHRGFEELCHLGGGGHPFIISRLGAVVGPDDTGPGGPFFGAERERLYDLQKSIGRCCRFVSVLSQAEADLFCRYSGAPARCVVVPTGTDGTISPPRRNPYSAFPESIALYAGNIRGFACKYRVNGGAEVEVVGQPQLNAMWQRRLNVLGGRLREKGIRLCFMGLGNVSALDPDSVTVLGPVPNAEIWDYHYFADVGIALAQGAVQWAECSKIPYYLRAGLPVVSETPIPNNTLIRETNHGLIVDYGDDEMMADAVREATCRSWNRSAVQCHMVQHHTWDSRARLYDRLIRQELGDEDALGTFATTALARAGKRA